MKPGTPLYRRYTQDAELLVCHGSTVMGKTVCVQKVGCVEGAQLEEIDDK